MRVRVDQQSDAVYVNLTDRAIKDSEEGPTESWSIMTTRAALSGSKSWMHRNEPKTPPR